MGAFNGSASPGHTSAAKLARVPLYVPLHNAQNNTIVGLRQVDAGGAADGIAAAGWAIDGKADEGAGVEPVRSGGMGDLMPDGVDGGEEAGEGVVIERAAGVVAGAVAHLLDSVKESGGR